MLTSLRSKLALSHLVVILLTAGVLVFISFSLLVGLHKRETFALLERSVTSNSLQVRQFFNNKSFLLQTIITSNEVASYTKKYQDIALISYFKQFQDAFDTLSYISPNGQEEVLMTMGSMTNELTNISNTPLFKKAIAEPGTVFYETTIDSTNSSVKVDLLIALNSYWGDKTVCLIRGTTSALELEQSLTSFAEDLTDLLMVTDENQKIILHPNKQLIGKTITTPFHEFGFGRREELGTKGLYATMQLATPNWRLIRIIPYETYSAVYKEFAKQVVLTLSLILAVGIIISIYSTKKILAPINRLTTALSNVSSSKKTITIEKYGIKELDGTVDSFNKMVQKLASTTFSKEYLDNILNSLQEGLFVVSLDGTIEAANQRTLDLLEISEEDLLDQPASRFITAEQVYTFFRSIKQVEFGGLETTVTTAKEKSVPVQLTISVLLDDDGDKLGFVCLILDISHKRKIESEKEQLRYQLHQAQRLETVGTLASGIAHDFNNILTVIIGFSQLLKEKVTEDPTGKNALEQILTASYRARDLVKQLLAFSRQEEHKKTVITLHPVINETLKMLRASIPSHIKIEQNISPDAYTVFTDPTQIQQVLMNLCTNASHAIKESGIISVYLGNIQVNENTIQPYYEEIPSGDYAEIVVSDDGHGIKEHDIDNIFDPFFTTKDVDEGTGLGLAVVHGIVTNLKGHILVQSKENHGTTFRILLPHTDANAILPSQGSTNQGELLAGKGEHILFVDDQQSLTDLFQNSLQLRGYKVTATTSPEKAFTLFREDPFSFDIVVTDFAMPKIKGDDLVNKIHKLRGDLPIILCTEYHTKLLGMDEISAGVQRVIKKPYTVNELIYNIVHVLHNPQVNG
nr:response regulator [Desulfobulbaceae bacterium]